MNRNCYCLIFNKFRGQLMVVSELASSRGKPCIGESRAIKSGRTKQNTQHGQCPEYRKIILALSLSLGAATPSFSQIIADPTAPASQRPTILQGAGGTPLVNIQTPSAAGVSRNTYRQFDVQSNGVTLNNARQSNPWLAGGEAKVILNEVNSSNPSYLGGAITVNGGERKSSLPTPLVSQSMAHALSMSVAPR